MLRDQARRTEEPSVPFVGRKSRTGSGIMLQSLLLRPPRFHRRVANDVTFPTRYGGSHSSIPLGNGEGVPVSMTYVLCGGTHPLNRRDVFVTVTVSGGHTLRKQAKSHSCPLQPRPTHTPSRRCAPCSLACFHFFFRELPLLTRPHLTQPLLLRQLERALFHRHTTSSLPLRGKTFAQSAVS